MAKVTLILSSCGSLLRWSRAYGLQLPLAGRTFSRICRSLGSISHSGCRASSSSSHIRTYLHDGVTAHCLTQDLQEPPCRWAWYTHTWLEQVAFGAGTDNLRARGYRTLLLACVHKG